MSTLIAYSSAHGAAAECARRLAEKIEGPAETVDLGKSGADLARYDWIVLGSSIYAGRVRREVLDFCRKNHDALLQKPLGIYFSCRISRSASPRSARSGEPFIFQR